VKHFVEKLKDVENITIKHGFVYSTFKREKVPTVRTHNTTLKLYNKEKILLQKHIATIELTAEEKADATFLSNVILVKSQMHCSLPRPQQFGEIMELDATQFELPNGQKLWLHVALDKATNKILAIRFDLQETLDCYLRVLYDVVTNFGAPIKIVTDCRSCFKVLRNATMDDTKMTQFGYICEKLGTDLYCTSISQKKSRVERMNGTIKVRIQAEMEMMNLT
jgi:transposase-like protein